MWKILKNSFRAVFSYGQWITIKKTIDHIHLQLIKLLFVSRLFFLGFNLASQLKSKKHLNFKTLRKSLSQCFSLIKDKRQQSKCDYSQHDALMSAFACMFFQDPSLLHFQKRLEQKHQRNNLKNIFDVTNIPSNNQLRDIIDNIESDALSPIFKDFHEKLRRHKHLESYAILPNVLMCTIDGTQYHSSKTVHCACCLTKTHKSGEITYSHGVLQDAIMHPDKKQVIPMMPEAIKNTDGTKKQDCEINAAKRFITRLNIAHPKQKFMICGDGLMSHQPMIEETLRAGNHYLFVAKPGDHKYLVEWLDAFNVLPSTEFVDVKGNTHIYTWQNNVPLNGNEKTINVNWFQYQFKNVKGKITKTHSWVSDIEITLSNVEKMSQAGRCRWKIENECFNTLKNQGYHLEHNYGHGKNNLSYNMYLLTLLAFTFHQIFELTDGVYQACRVSFGSKAHLWENLRSTIRMVIVEDWAQLMDLMLNPDEYEVMKLKKS